MYFVKRIHVLNSKQPFRLVTLSFIPLAKMQGAKKKSYCAKGAQSHSQVPATLSERYDWLNGKLASDWLQSMMAPCESRAVSKIHNRLDRIITEFSNLSLFAYRNTFINHKKQMNAIIREILTHVFIYANFKT